MASGDGPDRRKSGCAAIAGGSKIRGGEKWLGCEEIGDERVVICWRVGSGFALVLRWVCGGFVVGFC